MNWTVSEIRVLLQLLGKQLKPTRVGIPATNKTSDYQKGFLLSLSRLGLRTLLISNFSNIKNVIKKSSGFNLRISSKD